MKLSTLLIFVLLLSIVTSVDIDRRRRTRRPRRGGSSGGSTSGGSSSGGSTSGGSSSGDISTNVSGSNFGNLEKYFDNLYGTWVGGGLFTLAPPPEFATNPTQTRPNGFRPFLPIDWTIPGSIGRDYMHEE